MISSHSLALREKNDKSGCSHKKKGDIFKLIKNCIIGELTTMKEDRCMFKNISDWGMIEFLPKNLKGFQHELTFCMKKNLPIITGSSSAHECCAIAAHRARKEKVHQEYRERSICTSKLDFGKPILLFPSFRSGQMGRCYWKLKHSSASLLSSKKIMMLLQIL